MRTFIITALAIAALTPAAAHAQRGGMGRGGRGGGNGGFGKNGPETPKVLSSDDLDHADPARAMLDKAKALKLSGAQKQALDSVVKRYEWNTRVFSQQVDSLETASRAALGAGRAAQASSDSSSEPAGSSTRRALIDALQSIRDEFRADSTTASNRLNDDQRKTAEPFMAEASSRLGELLAGAVSTGRRGRG